MGHLLRSGDRVRKVSAEKARERRVVQGLFTLGMGLLHAGDERTQPVDVAGIAENRGERFQTAGVVGFGGDCLFGMGHSGVERAGRRQEPCQGQPCSRAPRPRGHRRFEHPPGVRQPAPRSGRVDQSRQRRFVVRVECDRPNEGVIRRRVRPRSQKHPPAVPPLGRSRRCQGRAERGRCARGVEQRPQGGHILIDVSSVHGARARELDQRTVIGLNQRPLAVALHLPRAAHVERQEAERIEHRHPGEVRRHAGWSPWKREVVQAWPAARLVRPDEEHVGLSDQPQRAVREHVHERRGDRAQIRIGDVVGMRPLAENPARREPLAGGQEEFAREECSDTRNPGI